MSSQSRAPVNSQQFSSDNLISTCMTKIFIRMIPNFLQKHKFYISACLSPHLASTTLIWSKWFQFVKMPALQKLIIFYCLTSLCHFQNYPWNLTWNHSIIFSFSNSLRIKVLKSDLVLLFDKKAILEQK